MLVLELAEKLFALAGGVALARPFLREQRWRHLLDAITQAKPDDAGAAEAKKGALSTVERHQQQFKPQDWRDGLIGVGCLCVSFTLGLVALLGG